MNVLRVTIALIACLGTHHVAARSWQYLDFDKAMDLAAYPKALPTTKRIVGIDGAVLYSFFKNLYEKNSMNVLQPGTQARIPKIIHQIWIGGPLPEMFEKFIATWKAHHPTWQYKLWLDDDIATLHLYNQALYDASTNNGQKSDIARYEILHRFGGVYVDLDYECLKPLDDLNTTYDFYIGLQPLDGYFVQVGIGLIGAIAGHPIIEHCFKTIKNDWHRKGAPSSTGPVHFTKSFYAQAGKSTFIDIALPARYLYPRGCQQPALPRSAWLTPAAYAVHHWGKTWMPSKYRQGEFKGIDNQEMVHSWNS